jgi:hypothetical protein
MGVAATQAVTAAGGGLNAAASAAPRFSNPMPNQASVIEE